MNCAACGLDVDRPEAQLNPEVQLAIAAAIVCDDEDAEPSQIPLDAPLIYEGKIYCRPCAHNLTHLYRLEPNEIACPVVDGKTGELIPFGTYPNIDWS